MKSLKKAYSLILYFNVCLFLQVQLHWWAAVRVKEPGGELHHVRRAGPLGGQDQPLRSLLGRRHWSQRICRSRSHKEKVARDKQRNIKGIVSSKIFCFRFFPWIIFPQVPENNIRANVFKKSRWYSRQVKVNDTGGAPWAANISANYR